jgi:hypothetical protein
MSNTVISLKKSSTPSAEPTILANGELAINYADGKLFYKHANGTILPFNTTGGNAFGTVNANGTLVVAGTSEAILTLISGNNISISADAINDTITIDSTGGASVNIGDTPPSTPANGDLWWNSVFGSLFIYYNDSNSAQWVETSPSSIGASVNIGDTPPSTPENGDLWWSSEFGSLFIYYNDSNSAQWVETSPSSIYANTAEQLAIAAFDKANNALPNTSGVSFAGDLYFPTGNVGIGTSSPSYPLDVNGNINSSNTVFAVHFDNVSDISLKENVYNLYLPYARDTINNLQPKEFTWKDSGEKSYGLIAQEVEQILPSIVHSKSDGTKTVNYIEIIAFLIAAVKDLQQQIDDINSK